MIRLKRLYAHNFKQLAEIELHFPDSARILIQGKNEAGKSTLFEAIFFALFGNALATETGARGLDGLIAYDTEKARVELDLACGDRLFKITRTIVRDKANTWELEIDREGHPPEEIHGNTAVNRRLIGELGFDGEALLNTCFVEQKKLEKLEGLSRAKREESLARLLNLDALVLLENEFKIRGEDKQELERLKKRAELADIQTELPPRESELASVESRLLLIDLRRAVQGAVQETRALQRLDSEICDLAVRRDELSRQAERIDLLKEAMLQVKEARDSSERASELAREIERLGADEREARQAADLVADLEKRAASIKTLGRRIRRLDQVGILQTDSQRRAEQLAAVQTRIEQLAMAVAADDKRIAELEQRQQASAVARALQDWLAATSELVSQDDTERAVAAQAAERDQLTHRFRVQAAGLVALALVFVVAAGLAQTWLALFAALAALALGGLAFRAMVFWREAARAAEALGRVRGQAQARMAANQTVLARIQEINHRLQELNAAAPATPEEARSQLAATGVTNGGESDGDLASELAAARERMANARAVLGELQTQNAIEEPAAVDAELARCRRVADKGKRLLGQWQPGIQAMAATLAVDQTPESVQRALYQCESDLDQARRRASERERIATEIVRRQEQQRSLETRAQEAFARAGAVRPAASPWSPSLTAKEYTAFGKELRGEYDAIGGEAAVRQLRQIEGELGRRQGERESRARNASALVARAIELLASIDRADELDSSPSLSELEELNGKFDAIALGDENTLRGQQRELVGRLHSLRDRFAQLDRELGLGGTALDPVACRAEYDEKVRSTGVRERAVEIVALARRRIVHKVLPATMDFMRRILPALTSDRYHDAQLDSESYKIQVWDERAGQGGAFKEKNIFSGGTKDQFSLALRLAFALATLPQERGTAPSFIFLDEPLGSFDEERAQALIYLLTEGEIARAFDQIFLISHVHVDERLFTHRVVLESGRVQSSDLPA